MHQSTGFAIWLTGMQGAGKSTLAHHLVRRFAAVGRRAELLDGDEPGEVLTGGPAHEDREFAVRRLGHVTKLLARNDVVAICAALSPRRDSRDAVRREVRRFVEVFVDCPLETLITRDSEGIYNRALAGELKNVTGIDDPYEPPTHPEVVIHSEQEPVDQAATRIFQALVDLKYVTPAEFAQLTGGQRARRARPARTTRRAGRRKLAIKAARRQAPKKMAARTTKASHRSGR